jgi:hypothetical protein
LLLLLPSRPDAKLLMLLLRLRRCWMSASSCPEVLLLPLLLLPLLLPV